MQNSNLANRVPKCWGPVLVIRQGMSVLLSPSGSAMLELEQPATSSTKDMEPLQRSFLRKLPALQIPYETRVERASTYHLDYPTTTTPAL